MTRGRRVSTEKRAGVLFLSENDGIVGLDRILFVF